MTFMQVITATPFFDGAIDSAQPPVSTDLPATPPTWADNVADLIEHGWVPLGSPVPSPGSAPAQLWLWTLKYVGE